MQPLDFITLKVPQPALAAVSLVVSRIVEDVSETFHMQVLDFL